MEFTYETETRDGAKVVTIGGKLGAATTDSLWSKLQGEMAEAEQVILDCRGVEYISSSGLQVFMRAIQAGKRLGKPKLICLAKQHSMFMKTLVAVGLSDHMTIRAG